MQRSKNFQSSRIPQTFVGAYRRIPSSRLVPLWVAPSEVEHFCGGLPPVPLQLASACPCRLSPATKAPLRHDSLLLVAFTEPNRMNRCFAKYSQRCLAT